MDKSSNIRIILGQCKFWRLSKNKSCIIHNLNMKNYDSIVQNLSAKSIYYKFFFIIFALWNHTCINRVVIICVYHNGKSIIDYDYDP